MPVVEQRPHTGSAPSFWLLAATLVFAPLFRAGNRPLPLLVLEFAALALLALSLYSGRYRHQLSVPQQLSLLALLLVPLLYCLPVGFGLWSSLPGRELYAQLLTAVGDPPQALLSLSLVPAQSLQATLVMLLPVGVFLAAVSLPTNDLQRLLRLLLVIGGLQALLGILQYGDGAQSILRFGSDTGVRNGTGTYVNRNHLAGFLEMLIPLTIAALATTLVGGSRRRSSRTRLVFFGSRRGHTAVVYIGLLVLLLLGVVFTRSRTGLVLALLGALIAAAVFSKKLKSDNLLGWLGIAGVFGVSLAGAAGLAPALQRFMLRDPLDEGRLRIFSAALQGIRDMFPLGSGPGTFQEVFPRYQQVDFQGFVNHAHNDYLQWVFETGGLALALIVVLLAFYTMRWRQLWIEGPWSTFRFSQVGAGIGIALLLLHELTDFNLHIPANMVFFAFLAAVFFHRHQLEQESITARRERAERDRARRQQRRIQPSAADAIDNPFGG